MVAELAERLVADRIDGLPDPAENLDLIGHENVLNQLAGHYASNRMHHAWLLSGPKGIGKATLAFRFAGHVFRHADSAEAPPNYEKPSASDSTESRIARGGHPNLLYLSKPWDEKQKKFKNDLTVDEIRRTVGFFGTTSGEKGWRICIVDAADDMNASAANALLKILEEPPAKTLFIVLSHAAGGLLPTIRSRCQRLPVKPLSCEQVLSIAERFEMLDGVSPADRALVGELSGGSVRRGLVLLNQDGVSLYRQIETLCRDPFNPDWTKIHDLATRLAPRAQDERFRLFMELIYDLIARQVTGRSADQADGRIELSALARWAELWEKTRQSASLADSYNLDRKQVILSLFKNMQLAA